MKKRFIGLLLVFALALAPVEARAQDGFEALAFIVLILAAGEVVIVGGNTVAGIGSAIQAGRDEPKLGWSIASLAAGGVGTVWGGLFTYAVLDGGDTEPALLAFGLVPLAFGVTNLSLGIANLVKRGRARRAAPRYHREPEIEPEKDDWVLAPILLETRSGREAPGLAAAVRF